MENFRSSICCAADGWNYLLDSYAGQRTNTPAGNEDGHHDGGVEALGGDCPWYVHQRIREIETDQQQAVLVAHHPKIGFDARCLSIAEIGAVKRVGVVREG